MVFLEEGCYRVHVFYKNILLQNGEFTCIVLNRKYVCIYFIFALLYIFKLTITN